MKFKIGDKVKIPTRKTTYAGIEDSNIVRNAIKRGQDHLFVTGINNDLTLIVNFDKYSDDGDYFNEEDLTLYNERKGVNKMEKEEERKYIVVNPACDNIENDRLLTKKEAISRFSAPSCVVDITNGNKYELCKSMRIFKKARKIIKKNKKKKGAK